MKGVFFFWLCLKSCGVIDTYNNDEGNMSLDGRVIKLRISAGIIHKWEVKSIPKIIIVIQNFQRSQSSNSDPKAKTVTFTGIFTDILKHLHSTVCHQQFITRSTP